MSTQSKGGLGQTQGGPHPLEGGPELSTPYALHMTLQADPLSAALLSTDRHHLGGMHFRGAINGPLVVSLEHQSVPLDTVY